MVIIPFSIKGEPEKKQYALFNPDSLALYRNRKAPKHSIIHKRLVYNRKGEIAKEDRRDFELRALSKGGWLGTLDGYLRKNLDVSKEVIVKDWDMVFIVDGFEGCLTGDTIIRINKNKLGRKYRLDYLYRQFKKPESFHENKRWKNKEECKVRSFKDNRIGLHSIKDVVYSGDKLVMKLTLKNGFSLKGTPDHKVMTDKGWVELQHLTGCKVMCDTPNAKPSGRPLGSANRDFTISGAKYHPYLSERRLLELHRAIFEANLNNLSLKEYLSIIFTNKSRAKKLVFVDPKEHCIHHIDGDHYNNDVNNLERITHEEHRRKHGFDNYVNFGQGVPLFVEVESIVHLGVEPTFDIICDEPYRNFCANDIVVHNSGKSVLAQQCAAYVDSSLSIDRICFTPEEFKKAINNAKKYQAVIYDEAYGGMSSRSAMGATNRALMSMLAEIRQKNLYVFIVLPCFFELDKYAAVWRSRALLHCYTGKGFERGFFAFYNQNRKKQLYVLGKQYYSYWKPKPNFVGKFNKGYFVDEDEYRAKKLKALKMHEADVVPRRETERVLRFKGFMRAMILFIKSKHEMTDAELSKMGGVGRAFIRTLLNEKADLSSTNDGLLDSD